MKVNSFVKFFSKLLIVEDESGILSVRGMYEMEELYKRIKKRRTELGMSQEELARRAGYTSRSTIARIEHGEINLPQSKVIDIAQALRVTPSYLMGWEDEEVAIITARQEETIEKFFFLTENNQILIDKFIDSLLEQQKG